MAKRSRTTRDLISAALGASVPPAGSPDVAAAGATGDGLAPAAAAARAAGADADSGADAGATTALDAADDAALIDLYFASDSAAERDQVLARLAPRDSALVRDFLLAMLAGDQDDALRLDAAQVLAARGEQAGLAFLEEVLAEPASADDFAVAVAGLRPTAGAALYGRLATMWQDPTLPPAHRLAAMRGLADVDGERACADFVPFVAAAAAEDPAGLPEDQLEAAIVTFLRHDHRAALPALAAVASRLATHPWRPEDVALASERADFVAEGIALLRD